MRTPSSLCKFVSLILVTSICILIFAPCRAVAETPPRDAGGRYLISSAAGLYGFAAAVNGGEHDACAVLVCDIDLNPGVRYYDGGTDIGSPTEWTPICNFSGSFDGNGLTVSGMYFNNTGNSQVGLFASNSGGIKNLNVSSFFVHAKSEAGGVCGYNSGTIENCSVSDGYVVITGRHGGGLCGRNDGALLDCRNDGISGDQSGDENRKRAVRGGMDASFVGGICGSSAGEISRCTSNAYVYGDAYENAYVGGIVGEATGEVHGCLNTGLVFGRSGSTGGICGKFSGGALYSCLGVGEVAKSFSPNYSQIGLICGENAGGRVQDCYFVRGDVTAAVGQNDGLAERLAGVGSRSALTDGAAAAVLRLADADAGWSQRLGVDALPSPGGSDAVFCCTEYSGCSSASDGRTVYRNRNSDVFLAAHTDAGSDALCDSCGGALGRIAATSILLGVDITVRYYVRLTDDEAGAVMKFTMNGSETAVSGERLGEYYVFDFPGVAPQCVGDSICATLTLGDAVLDSKPEYSVRSYCEALLGGDAAGLGLSEENYSRACTVVTDLLLYGGAAQRYLGYKTDALVSDGVIREGEVTVDTTGRQLMNNGVHASFTGAAVAFDSAPHIVFYFTADAVSGLELRLITPDGVVQSLTVTEEAPGLYSVITPGIPAVSYGKMYTVTAFRDGVPGASASYSIGCYAAANHSAAASELALAAYAYGLSSAAYAAGK